MKRKFTITALLVALLAVLAGPFASTPAHADQITLTYAIWDNNQLPAHQKIMEAFQAQHPDIKVDVQVIPWGDYWNKLQTAVAGGSAFDVFWMNGPNFPVYASKGVLMDLQDRMDKDKIDLSVFPESLIKLYSYQGHAYAFPKDFDTIGLYYNKDLFDAAGVSYPTDKWTWDDLQAAAKKLTKPGVWGFAATVIDDQAGYWNFIYQNGGSVISPDGSKILLDQPAACDAIKYLYSFVQDGSSPDGATMTASNPTTELFPGGKIAMITAGSWMAKTFKEAKLNVDVAPLPMGKERATIIHGLGNVMWSGTKYPDAAWELVKFLGSQEAEKILADSGTVIPAYKGLQENWVKSIPNMHLQYFLDELSYSVPYPTAAQGMEWNTKVAEVLGDVWTGNRPIDSACTDAVSEASPSLKPAATPAS